MTSSLPAALVLAGVLVALVATALYVLLSPARRARLRRLRSLVTLLQVADAQVRIETLERVHVLTPGDRALIAKLLRRELSAGARGAPAASPDQLVTVWFIRQVLALLSDSRIAVRGDAARVLRALLSREATALESDRQEPPLAHPVRAAVELAGGTALSAIGDARQQTRVLAFAEMLEAGLRPLVISVQAIETMTEEALEPLASALRDRSPRVRRTLCEVLAAMGGERAVELLVPLLQDPSPDIRARAAHSLGELKAGSAVAQLTQLLRDPIGQVRAAAGRALAEIGLPSSCPPILQGLSEECRREDAFEPARAAFIEAIAALADGGRDDLPQVLASLPRPVASRLAAALERAGVVSRWLAEPEVADQDRRLGSLLAISSQLGISQPFLEALDDREKHVRLRAAAALGHSHNPAALSAVARLLEDPEAAVRSQAAASLAHLGRASPLAVEPLAQAAGDPDSAVRLAAIAGLRQALAHTEPWRAGALPADVDLPAALAQAQRAVLAATEDADPPVRREVAQTLPLFNSLEAAEALVDLALTDEDQVVVETATRGMAEFRSPHLRRLLAASLEDRDDSRRARAIAVVGALARDAGVAGDKLLPYLVEALRDPSAQVAEAALASLAGAHLGALSERLIPELQHPDPRVRAVVAAQLGRSRAVEAVEALVEALADPDEEVRVSILASLSGLGRLVRKHQSALAARLSDPSPRVRAAATSALNTLRAAWAETAEAAQLFPEGPLSPAGAATLVEMAAEGDLKPLLWALNNSESAQSLASFLAGAGREKLEPLLTSLHQASEWDRVRAVAALSEALKQRGAADGYLAQLKAIHPGVRLTAVEIAGMLATREAVAALAEVLERDPVPEVRSRAATALAAAGGAGPQAVQDAARAALLRAQSEDPNEVVRVVATRALARAQEPPTLPPEAGDTAVSDSALPFPPGMDARPQINAPPP